MKVDDFIEKHKGEHFYCVYSLYRNKSVVYIGSTKNPSSRIKSHMNSDKDFDSVSVTRFESRGEATKAEAEAIVLMSPIYNKDVPPSSDYITAKKALSDAKLAISSVVKDIPVAFMREHRSYLKASDFEYFLDSVVNFAEQKIKEITDKDEN